MEVREVAGCRVTEKTASPSESKMAILGSVIQTLSRMTPSMISSLPLPNSSDTGRLAIGFSSGLYIENSKYKGFEYVLSENFAFST